MPRISIVALRWLLVFVNLGVLGLVMSKSYGFFQGGADELRTPLPEIASVAVPPPQQGGERVDVSQLTAALGRKPPVVLTQPPPAPVKAPEEQEKFGGPLSKWAISSVMTNPTTGDVYASLVEAQSQETGLPAANVRQPTANRRGRPIQQPSRNTRMRAGRPPQTAVKGEFVQVGDVLDESTSPSTITEITVEPPTVKYRNEGVIYTLDQVIELPEVQIEETHDSNGKLVSLTLVGKELDAEAAAENRAAMDRGREGSISTAAENEKSAASPPPGKGGLSEDRAGKVEQAQQPERAVPSKVARDRVAADNDARQLKELLQKLEAETDPEKRAEMKRELKESGSDEDKN
ncbi:MAG: hypothetical protein AB7O52_12345 [Planctomycetota bacterium]